MGLGRLSSFQLDSKNQTTFKTYRNPHKKVKVGLILRLESI